MPDRTTNRVTPAPARRGSTRTTGLLVAAGVGLAAVGLVGYVVLMRPRPEEGPRVARPQGVPKDVAAMAKGAGRPGEPAGAAEGVRIELADKKDPSRVATVLLAKSVRPLEGRRAAVTEPAALIFMKDGRTVRITAKSGLFSSFSADQAPERGTFEGEVRVSVYGPQATTRSTDWDALTPLALAEFGDRLEFDLPFGQVTVPGAFTVRGEGLTLTGVEAKIVLDDAGSAVRLISIARDIVAEYAPAAGGPAKAAGPSGPVGEASAAPGVQALYRVSLDSALNATSGDGEHGRRLDAAGAEGFLRLVDNRLRPEALAKIDTGRGDLETSPEDPEAATVAARREGFTLRSPGPLEVRATAEASPELERNDLFVRLQGAEEPVRFVDAGAGASGESPMVEYGATRGDLTMAGALTGSVDLAGARGEHLEASWFTLNLPTRVGQVRGAGAVHEPGKATEEEADPKERRIEWSEQADFRLLRASRAWELEWTQLTGDVTGTDGRGTFAAQDLTADFARGSQLKRVLMTGGAGARDGNGFAINADSLDLAFAERKDGKTDPSTLTAQGIVEARDKRRVLSAGLLEVSIIRDEKGSLTAKDVVAKDYVNFGGDDRIAASAPELHADVPGKRVELIGADSTITQGFSQIFGSLIKLDGAEGTLHVDSPGRFETAGSSAEGLVAARASWSKGMTFSDKTGVLEAVGDATAQAMPDAFTIDKLTAERVTVRTARDEAEKPAEESEFAPPTSGDRRVIGMTAEAAPGGGPVTVESRRYDGEVSLESTEGRRVERVQYLEGRTVTADAEKGTLAVPGAGKSLVLDRRALAEPGKAPLETATPGETGLIGLASGFRGTALFEWTEGMDFVRESGLLTLLGGVKITNERPADKTVVFVQAERATAQLSGLTGGVGGTGEETVRAELTRAEATGGVFARFKTGLSERELTADHAVYDAGKSELRIDAKAGGEVSLFDVSTATPVKAAELIWDLSKDRVEVVRPSPVTTPR